MHTLAKVFFVFTLLVGTDSVANAAPTVSIGLIAGAKVGNIINLTVPVSVAGGAANTGY